MIHPYVGTWIAHLHIEKFLEFFDKCGDLASLFTEGFDIIGITYENVVWHQILSRLSIELDPGLLN